MSLKLENVGSAFLFSLSLLVVSQTRGRIRVLVRRMDLFYFSSLFPFFDFDLDIVCFILSFSCGYYAVSSVSVSAATRSAYDMYLDTYVR